MDEFKDLEDELRFDQIIVDTESIKSLVKSIAYNQLEPTIFFTEQSSTWNVSKRIGFLILGIATLPLLGLGLVFIYIALFDSGPFFENCEIVEAKVYLAEQNLVIDYKIADDKIMKLKSIQLTNKSHIRQSLRDVGGETSSTTSTQYFLATDENEMELLSYHSSQSSEERRRIIKLISKFAKIANLKISR